MLAKLASGRMSDAAAGASFVPAQLPSAALVYRGIRAKFWVDEDGVISHEAFFRRPVETGLSVGIDPQGSVTDFAHSMGLKQVHGALKLKVEAVRAIKNAASENLDVINNKAQHWEIQGIPEFDEADETTHHNRDEAEYLAGELIEISAWQYRPRHLQK